MHFLFEQFYDYNNEINFAMEIRNMKRFLEKNYYSRGFVRSRFEFNDMNIEHKIMQNCFLIDFVFESSKLFSNIHLFFDLMRNKSHFFVTNKHHEKTWRKHRLLGSFDFILTIWTSNKPSLTLSIRKNLKKTPWKCTYFRIQEILIAQSINRQNIFSKNFPFSFSIL